VSELIRISEIFGPTVQGEGPLIGRPTVFVRSGGCDYRCQWCDTLYAVLPSHHDEWQSMTPAAILTRIGELTGGRPVLVSLSGGNPALQPLAPLIALGRAAGYEFALETQASVARPWFAALDWLLLSPKPPSSGMATDWDAFDACVAAAAGRPRLALKVTVFDGEDYAYARAAAARYPELPFYLQLGNPLPAGDGAAAGAVPDLAALRRQYAELVAKVAQDRWFTATILPQLHVFIWGNRRGV
jgi:7-carboxy-7-deazaguanine synthase